MKKLFFASVSILLSFPVFCQETVSTVDTLRKDALNVYMTASSYIKKEITFINYVRDLKEADLYIISTYQSTGAGGTEITYFLVGQNKFAGMNDTITVSAFTDDTEENIRMKQVKALKMGLMRYVLKTPLAKYFDIRFTEEVQETVATDKWKNWVFNISLYTYLDGEKSYKMSYLDGSFSASHVTEKNKFEFDYSYGWNNTDYNIDGTIINSYSRSQYAEMLYVKGLNDHWSVGSMIEIMSSVYSNYDLSLSLSPAIEYDIYPYAQANRHQLRLLYTPGYEYCNYVDTTMYNKTTESLGFHSLLAAYKIVEKWGSINLRLTWKNYFHDWSKNNLRLNGSMNFRIVKGLTFSIGGSVSMVHDQISLVKGGATYEEMLLRRKEIATQYTYYTYCQVAYTFGSIYTNVVNPRFGD
jgi:hypothetical protein